MADHDWIDEHEPELTDVAIRLHVSEDAVRLTALLMLDGLGDDEIVASFRTAIVSTNSHPNPVERVATMVGEVRDVVASGP